MSKGEKPGDNGERYDDNVEVGRDTANFMLSPEVRAALMGLSDGSSEVQRVADANPAKVMGTRRKVSGAAAAVTSGESRISGEKPRVSKQPRRKARHSTEVDVGYGQVQRVRKAPGSTGTLMDTETGQRTTSGSTLSVGDNPFFEGRLETEPTTAGRVRRPPGSTGTLMDTAADNPRGMSPTEMIKSGAPLSLQQNPYVSARRTMIDDPDGNPFFKGQDSFEDGVDVMWGGENTKGPERSLAGLEPVSRRPLNGPSKAGQTVFGLESVAKDLPVQVRQNPTLMERFKSGMKNVWETLRNFLKRKKR